MGKIRNMEEKKLIVAYCILKRNGEKQELTNKLIRDVWKSVANEDLCIDRMNLTVNYHGELYLKHKRNVVISKKVQEDFCERKKEFDEIFVDVRAYVEKYNEDELKELLGKVRKMNQNNLFELAAPLHMEVMQFVHDKEYMQYRRLARYHVIRHCKDDYEKIDRYISGDYEEVRDKLLKEQMREKKK